VRLDGQLVRTGDDDDGRGDIWRMAEVPPSLPECVSGYSPMVTSVRIVHRVSMTTSQSPSPAPNLLSGRTLFRLGLALLVLAAVFLLRHSIEQGWIGPLARVALAGGAGLAMVGTGLAVSSRRPAYGILLQGAGAAVLFFTAYAAHAHYELTSTAEAFMQLVAVAVLTLGLAHNTRSELLAGLGLTAAAAAPTLIEGRLAIAEAEIGYIVVIAGVSSFLFFRNGWSRMHSTTALALLTSVAVDVVPGLADDRSLVVMLESALVVTWAMLVVVPLIGTVRHVGDRVTRITVPIVTSSFGSLVLYAGTRMIFSDVDSRFTWAALALALAAGHLLAGRALRAVPDAEPVSSAQLIPAVSLTVVALVEGLTGDWVLVGASLLSLAMVFAGHNGGHRRLADGGHLLFLVTAVMAVGTTAIVTSGTRTLLELIPGAAVLTTAGVLGWVIRHTEDRDLSSLYIVGAYLGSLLWMAVEIPRLVADGLAWVTGGWAVIGVAAIVAGRMTDQRLVLGAGFGTIGLALGKLFLVDLAEASPLTRIALFAGIGVLLAGGGYWLGDWSLDSESESTEVDAEGSTGDSLP
jgi:uncharacterized membrane protein